MPNGLCACRPTTERALARDTKPSRARRRSPRPPGCQPRVRSSSPNETPSKALGVQKPPAYTASKIPAALRGAAAAWSLAECGHSGGGKLMLRRTRWGSRFRHVPGLVAQYSPQWRGGLFRGTPEHDTRASADARLASWKSIGRKRVAALRSFPPTCEALIRRPV